MATIVFDGNYLIMDKRVCTSDVDLATQHRSGVPDNIRDNQVKIELVTPSMDMPTFCGSKMVAMGKYGLLDNDITDMLILEAKRAFGSNIVEGGSYGFRHIDISNVINTPMATGVLFVFENSGAIHMSILPTPHSDKLLQKLANRSVPTRISIWYPGTNRIHSTSAESSAYMDLLMRVMPVIPNMNDGHPVETAFLILAHADPYCSYDYSVFGVKENILYPTVSRPKEYIAQVLRATDGLISLTNAPMHK